MTLRRPSSPRRGRIRLDDPQLVATLHEPDCARRSSLARILAVARRLRSGRPFTAPSLASEVGVDLRTIKRDLRLLRALGWRITWRGDEGAYTLDYAPTAVLL